MPAIANQLSQTHDAPCLEKSSPRLTLSPPKSSHNQGCLNNPPSGKPLYDITLR